MNVVINAPGNKLFLSEVVYVIVFVLHLCDNRDPSAFNVRRDPLVLFSALFVFGTGSILADTRKWSQVFGG